MTNTIEERVARGAALLDQVNPGWESEIDLGKLSVKRCDRCVLGQLYGGYDTGANTLGISAYGDDSAVSRGFWGDPKMDTFKEIADEYRDLDAAWVKLITERMEMRALELEVLLEKEKEKVSA